MAETGALATTAAEDDVAPGCSRSIPWSSTTPVGSWAPPPRFARFVRRGLPRAQRRPSSRTATRPRNSHDSPRRTTPTAWAAITTIRGFGRRDERVAEALSTDADLDHEASTYVQLHHGTGFDSDQRWRPLRGVLSYFGKKWLHREKDCRSSATTTRTRSRMSMATTSPRSDDLGFDEPAGDAPGRGHRGGPRANWQSLRRAPSASTREARLLCGDLAARNPSTAHRYSRSHGEPVAGSGDNADGDARDSIETYLFFLSARSWRGVLNSMQVLRYNPSASSRELQGLRAPDFQLARQTRRTRRVESGQNGLSEASADAVDARPRAEGDITYPRPHDRRLCSSTRRTCSTAGGLLRLSRHLVDH